MTTSLALQIHEFNHNGFYLEDIGSAKTLNHYHKFLFYINITQIEISLSHLWTNTYLLQQKCNSSCPLINTLIDNCIEIENELSKFNYRSKRAIELLGSTIRFITGNLDQRDLNQINNQLGTLFSNQNKIVMQIDKITSFANHITNRYINDFKNIERKINSTFEALNYINEEVNKHALIDHYIHLSQKLISTIKTIQRTVTLSFNGITNLEVIKTEELKKIIHHLIQIYQKTELIDLEAIHLFKIIEFSKLRVLSVGKIITCILYIPILHPNPYLYQRVYPIPNRSNKIILPPASYRLDGLNKEIWMKKQCSTIENQTICIEKPVESKCSLKNLTTCNFAQASNDYKIHRQLENSNILLSCKNSLKILEECGNKINYEETSGSSLISSNRSCRVIIDDTIYENVHYNLSYEIPTIKLEDFKPQKSINLEQNHLEDVSSLKEEAEELKYNIDLHPLIHISHLTVTTILLIILVTTCATLLLFRKNLQKLIIWQEEDQEQSKEEEIQPHEIPPLYPRIPTAPCQDEDVLT